MSLQHRRILLLLLVAVIALMPSVALANSAEPPGLIVAVSTPPEDLILQLRFENEPEAPAITLQAEKKAWVTYYRFFYHTMWDVGIHADKCVEDTVLLAETEGTVLEFELPEGAFSRYNNLLELDLKNGELRIGQEPWRMPLLVALRVLLTLVIEGAVFFMFGYRQKRTWIAFLICNLVTQTALNVMITGPQLGYWQIVYALMEILIFICESAALGSIVKEKKWGINVLCVLLANTLSLVLGGFLIAHLPV